MEFQNHTLAAKGRGSKEVAWSMFMLSLGTSGNKLGVEVDILVIMFEIVVFGLLFNLTIIIKMNDY